jgi:hypothetical protein
MRLVARAALTLASIRRGEVMIRKWEGQRVVMLCGRYIWRGKLEAVEEPLVFLSDAYQVIDHGADTIREEIKVTEAVVNLQACESIFPEGKQLWTPIIGR